MTTTKKLQNIIELLGGNETSDKLITTKLNRIIELMGGEFDSKLISEQLDMIIELLIIPGEYERIEYIESSGTQYIDTGFIMKNQDAIEIDIYFFDTSRTSIAYLAAGARSALREQDISARVFNDRIGFVKNTSVNSDVSDVSYSRHTIGIKGNTYFIDGTSKEVSDWNNADDCIYSCWLFGCNQNGVSSGTLRQFRIYSCRMWDGEVLVRNFIPCIRKSDSVAGLYDAVNKIFYTNAGTGEFIVPE